MKMTAFPYLHLKFKGLHVTVFLYTKFVIDLDENEM